MTTVVGIDLGDVRGMAVDRRITLDRSEILTEFHKKWVAIPRRRWEESGRALVGPNSGVFYAALAGPSAMSHAANGAPLEPASTVHDACKRLFDLASVDQWKASEGVGPPNYGFEHIWIERGGLWSGGDRWLTRVEAMRPCGTGTGSSYAMGAIAAQVSCCPMPELMASRVEWLAQSFCIAMRCAASLDSHTGPNFHFLWCDNDGNHGVAEMT